MLVVVCYVSKKDLYLDIWFHSIPDIQQTIKYRGYSEKEVHQLDKTQHGNTRDKC